MKFEKRQRILRDVRTLVNTITLDEKGKSQMRNNDFWQAIKLACGRAAKARIAKTKGSPMPVLYRYVALLEWEIRDQKRRLKAWKNKKARKARRKPGIVVGANLGGAK